MAEKVEIWYRGEGAGVSPAKPGGHLHDFGDGVYLTDREDVAKVYASRRAPTPSDQRVWMVAVERSTLGHVLDLTLDSRWHKFMTSPIAGGKSRLDYLKIKHELYGQFFEEFLSAHKINIKAYDVVIGPEYNLGGKQLAILHKGGMPAKLAARIRTLFRPVTAVARWVVSTAVGIPVDVKVAPSPGTLKVRFAKVVGGSVLAIGVTLLLSYLGSKITQKMHEKIIADEIKSFEPEIQKTVDANKEFIVHSIASGKPVYAVVAVTVEYWYTVDGVSFNPPMQSIPGVKLDEVRVRTDKIDGPGKSYTRNPSYSVTIDYHPYTMSSELTVPAEDVERYKVMMQEYRWYEDTLKSEHLLKADIERLTKEKDLLKELIQKSF